MPQRQFLDAQGFAWTVWDVLPSRVANDLNAAWLAGRTRDRAWDGERQPRPRASLPAEYAGGWLCFERVGEKRRLAPVPRGWDRLMPTELARLCATAAPVPSRGAARRAAAVEHSEQT